MNNKEHGLDDCLARVMQMSEDVFCNISIADKQCLKETLMEIIHLREHLHDLREAISPGRIGKPEYYLGVAARMRSKETVIRPLAGPTQDDIRDGEAAAKERAYRRERAEEMD